MLYLNLSNKTCSSFFSAFLSESGLRVLKKWVSLCIELRADAASTFKHINATVDSAESRKRDTAILAVSDLDCTDPFKLGYMPQRFQYQGI